MKGLWQSAPYPNFGRKTEGSCPPGPFHPKISPLDSVRGLIKTTVAIQDKRHPHETGRHFCFFPLHQIRRHSDKDTFSNQMLSGVIGWLKARTDGLLFRFFPLQIFFYAFRKEKQRRKYYLRTTISWKKAGGGRRSNRAPPHHLLGFVFLSVCVCVFTNEKICWMRESVRNTRRIDCCFLIPWWC